MIKIGRNDPCPCGSGKKYKKCCIGKELKLKADLSPPAMEPRAKHRIPNLSSYKKVNALTSEEIIEKLKELGISFEEEAFSQDVETFYAAGEITDKWLQQQSISINTQIIDFTHCAAWVLWERFAPVQNLPAEALSQLYTSGMDDSINRDPIAACDKWLKLWDGIKYRVNPARKNLKYLDKHYEYVFSIRNFVQDVEFELNKAGDKNPAYFEKRIVYCQEFCDLFPKEDVLILHDMQRSLAESYSFLGKYDQADDTFRKLAADYPDNPWSYIGWGDIYFIDMKQNFSKAKELYEKALAISKVPEDVEIVKERLESLNKSM